MWDGGEVDADVVGGGEGEVEEEDAGSHHEAKSGPKHKMDHHPQPGKNQDHIEHDKALNGREPEFKQPPLLPSSVEANIDDPLHCLEGKEAHDDGRHHKVVEEQGEAYSVDVGLQVEVKSSRTTMGSGRIFCAKEWLIFFCGVNHWIAYYADLKVL